MCAVTAGGWFFQSQSREEIKEIIGDTVRNYDEKRSVEDHPDGIFTEFSKNYGCDCGITRVVKHHQYNRFHVDYYFPFFRELEDPQEQVTVKDIWTESHLQEPVMI